MKKFLSIKGWNPQVYQRELIVGDYVAFQMPQSNILRIGVVVDAPGKIALFPLSSMTEEQKFEFNSLQVENSKGGSYSTLNECSIMIDWCYKNHIDINGLIPMGLANDATGKNIY